MKTAELGQDRNRFSLLAQVCEDLKNKPIGQASWALQHIEEGLRRAAGTWYQVWSDEP